MQLKRDTEYALRIMICMAEHLKKERKENKIPASTVVTKTGIPFFSFIRVCGCLEESGLVKKTYGEDGEHLLGPGRDFWNQSLYSIGAAVEGNMDIFAVFDSNSHVAQIYGKKLAETQKRLNLLLSKVTLKDLVRGGENSM